MPGLGSGSPDQEVSDLGKDTEENVIDNSVSLQNCVERGPTSCRGLSPYRPRNTRAQSLDQ